MLSQIKDRKHIEQNFHSVASFMPRGGTGGGVKNFSVGICDGTPSTVRSSYILHLSISENMAGRNIIITITTEASSTI